MKKWFAIFACGIALVAACAYGVAEFRNTQNLTVFTSASDVVWFYAEWDYVANAQLRSATGVGSSATVPVYWPYYNRYYGSYFYDYSIGKYYSIMYSYWAPI